MKWKTIGKERMQGFLWFQKTDYVKICFHARCSLSYPTGLCQSSNDRLKHWPIPPSVSITTKVTQRNVSATTSLVSFYGTIHTVLNHSTPKLSNLFSCHMQLKYQRQDFCSVIVSVMRKEFESRQTFLQVPFQSTCGSNLSAL